jgi:hypothetical protein
MRQRKHQSRPSQLLNKMPEDEDLVMSSSVVELPKVNQNCKIMALFAFFFSSNKH